MKKDDLNFLHTTANAWLDEARILLERMRPANSGQSINQRLRRNADLVKALSGTALRGHPCRTIHSVKGMEFPAVCVAMSPSTAKGILEFLTAAGENGENEEAREIYVGASRVQSLLAIALLRTQASRPQQHGQ